MNETLPLNSKIPNACIACLSALTLVLSIGCGPRLSSTQTIELQANDIRTILIDSISRDQTVTVTASAESEFSIHIHLEGDESEVDAAIALGKASEKILAQAENTKEAKVEFDVPSGKVAAVRFQSWSSEATSVNYKISN